MPHIVLHRFLMRLIGAILLGLLMTGCNAKDADQAIAEDDEIGLQVKGLNYSGIPIGVFYVNDQWGG